MQINAPNIAFGRELPASRQNTPVQTSLLPDQFVRFGSRRPIPQILQTNNQGRFITPSHLQYYHQWLWDSALHAVILSRFDMPAAQQELESLFDEQWPNGFVAQIRFNPNIEATYRPNQSDWGTGRPTSGITQPPLMGMALRELQQQGAPKAFVEDIFDKTLQYHEWMKAEREVNNTGLVGIVHPWESGTDNSPIFDAARDRLVAGVYKNVNVPPRADTKTVNAEHRPKEADYKVYWGLLNDFKALGWNQADMTKQSKFLMAEPLFNTMWVKSNDDMADVADQLAVDARTAGEPEVAEQREAQAVKLRAFAEEGRQGMRQYLWNDQDGFFYAYDFRANEQVKIKTVNGLVPLYGKIPTPAQAARLVKEHYTNPQEFYGGKAVPSTAFNEGAYDPLRYWRGPAWINTQWFLINGLKDYKFDALSSELSDKTKALTRQSGFREYYDARTGEGLGARDFSWSTLSEIL